jgi:thiol:disulfide interchange protein DsbC
MNTTVKALALAGTLLLTMTACNANATSTGTEQVQKHSPPASPIVRC